MGTSSPARSAHPPRSDPHRFRWADVAQADRDWLRRRTEDVETWAYRSACDTVRIGVALAEIRGRLPRKFEPWLWAETAFSPSHAYRLIATGRAFGPYVSQIERVEPSALYLLAQDKVPQTVRDHVVQLAESGARVTRALALEIVDAHQPVAVSATKQRAYERLKKRLDEGQAAADADLDRMEGQDVTRLLVIGRAVENLALSESMLSVTKVDDKDDVVLFAVTCHGPGHGPRTVIDRQLARALQVAGGDVATKYCVGCDRRRPTNQFGCNRSMPDLLMIRCKFCERARKKLRREKLKRARARKRAAKAAGGSGASPTLPG